MKYKVTNYKTTKQVAEELGIGPAGVRYLIRTGKLEAEKVGRDYIIPEDATPNYTRKRPQKREDRAPGRGAGRKEEDNR
jgi:excisionase family DNA binding protein